MDDDVFEIFEKMMNDLQRLMKNFVYLLFKPTLSTI